MAGEHEELRLRVSRDGEIRIEHAGPQTRLGQCFIELSDDENDADRQTLDVLIGMLAEDRLRKASEFKLLGARLYSVLFENEIGTYLHSRVQENRGSYLRLVLAFEDPTLAEWPWEYLYCAQTRQRPSGGYFFTGRDNLLLSRRVPQAFKSVRVEREPVRVLFVASSPEGAPVRYAEVLEKIESLTTSSDDNASPGEGSDTPRITVIPLLPDPKEATVPGSTYSTFLETVKTDDPHIVHFLGHGEFKDGQGKITFMKKDGSGDPITDQQFAEDLRREAGESLRMVFIQACESGRSDRAKLRDRYQAVSGIATNLAEKEIPAVVAMHYAIDQDFASVFACALYDALAGCTLVDVAVQQARQAVLKAEREQREDQEISERPAFAMPVLYWTTTDALFPVQAVQQPTAAEPMYCEWCRSEKRVTEIGAEDNFCPSGHVVRCQSCKCPVRRIGDHCQQCGELLLRPAQFEAGEPGKRINLTPAADRAAGPPETP